MGKRWWIEDEWYPVVVLMESNVFRDNTDGVEIPDELLERYEKNREEFHAIEDELRKYLS